jgi:hypothetical protein
LAHGRIGTTDASQWSNYLMVGGFTVGVRV